jgi:hypothetical protein
VRAENPAAARFALHGDASRGVLIEDEKNGHPTDRPKLIMASA